MLGLSLFVPGKQDKVGKFAKSHSHGKGREEEETLLATPLFGQ